MRILQLSPKLPYPAKDGGSLATLNLSRGLSDLGNELTILAINTKKHYFPPHHIPAELTRKIRFKSVSIDTSLKPVNLLFNLFLSDKPYHLERFHNKVFAKSLENLLKKEYFDVIQTEGPYFFNYLPLIRKYSNAKIALRAHNVENEIWKKLSEEQKNPIHKRYLKITAKRIEKLEKRMVSFYDMVIPITHEDEIFFKNQPNCPETFVVPFGVDFNKYKISGDNATKNSLCFIGALDWKPNQSSLLWFIDNVWKPLIKKNKNISFHVAGRNAPAWLKDKLNIERLIFHDEVDDALEFIRNYKIMVAPLFSGSGIRVKIIEAMALQKLVITTSIGSAGIDSKPGKHLLLANSAREFQEQIIKIIKDIESLDKIAEDARYLIQTKYDNNKICKSLNNFYSK